MRVLAVLVVICGCRVTASDTADASTPRGDGLPERVVTDAALWADTVVADVRATDATSGAAPDHGGSDRSPDASAALDSAPAPVCSLLQGGCVGREACYPFPYEGTPSGETRCAFQGVGSEMVPCQSQLDCDGNTLCTAPGRPDSICAQRCATSDSPCPTGMRCVPFYSYPGVGVCLWM